MAAADAVLEAGIFLRAAQRIRDIEHVALDEEAAGPAKLPPFSQELALLVKNLDAAVGTVGDIEPPLLVHRKPVRRVEFPGAGAQLAPAVQEIALAVVFQNPVVGFVAVAVG